METSRKFLLRSGEDIAGGGESHWNEGRRSSVVAGGDNLTEVGAALLLNLAAGKKLDLEVHDVGLDIRWDSFEAESVTLEFIRSHKGCDLVVELVDLVIAGAESLKSNSDGLLVGALRLESLDLVLAFSEELLGFWGWVKVHHVLELSSSQ